MKLLSLLLVGVFSLAAQAEQVTCDGESADFAAHVTVSDNTENELLSDYKVTLTQKNSQSAPSEEAFTASDLVYGRGITGTSRTEKFETIKLVFDGRMAVMMYAFYGSKGEQIPLSCETK